MKRIRRTGRDPGAFRASASQLRRMAAGMTNVEARNRMLEIAAEYEAFALIETPSAPQVAPRRKLTISLS
jgi:hypothetical protein